VNTGYRPANIEFYPDSLQRMHKAWGSGEADCGWCFYFVRGLPGLKCATCTLFEAVTRHDRVKPEEYTVIEWDETWPACGRFVGRK
jgi:hypothetical protein